MKKKNPSWAKSYLNVKDCVEGIYKSIISSSFTNTNYPIQYYFEFIDNKHSKFSPGFNKFLSNQPYYLLRQKQFIDLN